MDRKRSLSDAIARPLSLSKGVIRGQTGQIKSAPDAGQTASGASARKGKLQCEVYTMWLATSRTAIALPLLAGRCAMPERPDRFRRAKPNHDQRPVLMRRTDGTARLYMPYDADCIEQLKGRVPASLRSWDKGDKSWLIESQGIALTIEIVRGYFGTIEDIPAPKSHSKAVTTPHAVLHLTEDAPLDLVTVVYRHLAKMNHPDKGGNTRAMQDINEAFARITKEGGRA